ncbi:hypothetical protein [Flexithrix dorotheae]|uniref:hypothetical protein n=1 Tax=Flexithrix dorotheae TaxID=70993 RepID=UPI00036ADEF3|nr:hypothetical protein [Flexithrix dorotheae]
MKTTLRIGGTANFIIAFLHILGLFWADKMFEVTGIKPEMDRAAEMIHPLYPYFITVVVAVFFTLFGCYAFSAINQFKKLPLIKLALWIIGIIYLGRGIGGFLFMKLETIPFYLAASYSLIALLIGACYIIGAKLYSEKYN